MPQRRKLIKKKNNHTSEIRGLCLMKCSSSETLQNLPYFWNKTTQVFFSFFISCYFNFVPPLILRGKIMYHKMKKEKKLLYVVCTWLFLFQKYGKFWSASLEHCNKHKPLIFEECNTVYTPEKFYFSFFLNNLIYLFPIIMYQKY